MTDKPLKFHLGFPVDTGDEGSALYYLLYPETKKYHRIGVIGERGAKKIEENKLPESIISITNLLKTKNRSLLFKSSKEKDRTIITDCEQFDLPDGGSSSVACYLAGNACLNTLDADKVNAPVILISCAFFGDPEKRQLLRVTNDDTENARKSLMKKWESIEEITKSGRKAGLILLKQDSSYLVNCLTKEKKPHTIIEVEDLGKILLKKSLPDIPFITPLETSDFSELSGALKISCDEKDKEKTFFKATTVFVSGIVFLIFLAAVLMWSFFQLNQMSSGSLIRSQYKIMCYLGSISCCNEYGTMLDDGKYGSQDKAEARKYYDKACEKGGAMSCYNLGMMYDLGQGGSENNSEAAKYFKIACERDDMDGCVMYGKMLDNGEGVKQNKEEACEKYSLACDRDHALGCANYSASLNNGECGEKDFKKACEGYKKSCELGVKMGCERIPSCTEQLSKPINQKNNTL